MSCGTRFLPRTHMVLAPEYLTVLLETVIVAIFLIKLFVRFLQALAEKPYLVVLQTGSQPGLALQLKELGLRVLCLMHILNVCSCCTTTHPRIREELLRRACQVPASSMASCTEVARRAALLTAQDCCELAKRLNFARRAFLHHLVRFMLATGSSSAG